MCFLAVPLHHHHHRPHAASQVLELDAKAKTGFCGW
jgi:hypothetical protein